MYAILDLVVGEYLSRWDGSYKFHETKEIAERLIITSAVKNSRGERFLYLSGKLNCPDLGILDEQLCVVEVDPIVQP